MKKSDSPSSIKNAMERGDLWMRRALALHALLRQSGQDEIAAQVITSKDKAFLDTLIERGIESDDESSGVCP